MKLRGIAHVRLHWRFYLQAVPYFLRHPLHFLYYFQKGEIPWLPFVVIDWLKDNLQSSDKIIEFGMGGSTRFFLDRVNLKNLISVEHDKMWSNLAPYSFFEPDYDKYPRTIRDLFRNWFDLILIDGIERNACIRESMPKVRPGGYIILDNSEEPEYQEGIALLKDWERRDFYGPGLYNRYFWQTSIFRKPL